MQNYPGFSTNEERRGLNNPSQPQPAAQPSVYQPPAPPSQGYVLPQPAQVVYPHPQQPGVVYPQAYPASYQQGYPQQPQQPVYHPYPPQVVVGSAALDAQKQSLYNSGCMTGCCLTFLFSAFSGICLPMQSSTSGKLGYMKGMGLMFLFSGILSAILSFAVILSITDMCGTATLKSISINTIILVIASLEILVRGKYSYGLESSLQLLEAF